MITPHISRFTLTVGSNHKIKPHINADRKLICVGCRTNSMHPNSVGLMHLVTTVQHTLYAVCDTDRGVISRIWLTTAFHYMTTQESGIGRACTHILTGAHTHTHTRIDNKHVTHSFSACFRIHAQSLLLHERRDK